MKFWSIAYWQENLDWLGHIIEAMGIALVVALLFWALGAPFLSATVVGGVFAVGHFHGREKRDYEVSVKMKPPHLKGYYIWRWNSDQLTDFLPVVAVFIIYCIWLFA